MKVRLHVGLPAAVLAGLAMLVSAGGAQALSCDGCPGGGTTQGQGIQFTFDSFTICSEACDTRGSGQTTAFVTGAQYPPVLIFPPNPCDALAEGKLYLPGAEDVLAIGKVFPPNPFRPGYLFDGHLVPASATPPVAYPPQPIRFLGKLFPPNPC